MGKVTNGCSAERETTTCCWVDNAVVEIRAVEILRCIDNWLSSSWKFRSWRRLRSAPFPASDKHVSWLPCPAWRSLHTTRQTVANREWHTVHDVRNSLFRKVHRNKRIPPKINPCISFIPASAETDSIFRASLFDFVAEGPLTTWHMLVGRLVRRPGGPPRQMLKEEMERKRVPRSLAIKGRLYSDKLFAVAPRVPSYATAHEAGLPKLARASLNSQSAPGAFHSLRRQYDEKVALTPVYTLWCILLLCGSRAEIDRHNFRHAFNYSERYLMSTDNITVLLWLHPAVTLLLLLGPWQ